ncbi:MAG: hypothetical protein J0L75_13555 [Spirochaetes bacterium]|nr:hypothetical protein [Spirochaetota bacterium]
MNQDFQPKMLVVFLDGHVEVFRLPPLEDFRTFLARQDIREIELLA